MVAQHLPTFLWPVAAGSRDLSGIVVRNWGVRSDVLGRVRVAGVFGRARACGSRDLARARVAPVRIGIEEVRG